MPLTSLLAASVYLSLASTPPPGPYMDFGGMYGYHGGGVYTNPYTGAASCPSGYATYSLLGSTNTDYPLYYCGRVTTGGTTPVADFGGMYGVYSNGSAAAYYNNPFTGSNSCPTGYTATMVLGSSGIDYPLWLCHRPHNPSSKTFYRLGGLYGWYWNTSASDHAPYNNPVTGAATCPSGYQSYIPYGTGYIDYWFAFCYYKVLIPTTRTYTLSWPEKLPNKNCRFGDTAMGHQAATNSYASGRLEEALTITGLAGQRIVSLSMASPSPSTFKYDDVMLLTLNNSLVMASDNRAAGYLAGKAPGSIGTQPVSYAWSPLLNKNISNENKQPAWCTSGATTCSVPVTEATGSISVNIPNFESVDTGAYPTAPDARTFRLVTIGDNDDGTYNNSSQTQDTDCSHGNVTLQLTVTSVPAN